MDFTWMIMCIVWICKYILKKMGIDRAESEGCFLEKDYVLQMLVE